MRSLTRPWGLAGTLLLATSIVVQAVTPLSPHLDEPSRRSLTEALAQAGIPATGSSAVLISLLAILGEAPARRHGRYREPYPQLPDIDADATISGPDCAAVYLAIRPKADPRRARAMAGTYCIEDRMTLTWRERSLRVDE